MTNANHWRIGIISDLHGNAIALETVLSALARTGIDQLICLGDVAVFGPSPQATIARLRELNCPVIMGNTDDWALSPRPHPYRNSETVYYNAIELWGAEQLTEDDRAFIRTFVPAVVIELGKTTLLCYHGSPRSYDEGILATTPEEELATIFADQFATLALGGHTHSQMIRRYSDMLIVNPGSVGVPFAFDRGATAVHFPPWAEYALIEITENAQGPTLQVQLNRVPVDMDAVISAIKTSGMPHSDWYISRWRHHTSQK